MIIQSSKVFINDEFQKCQLNIAEGKIVSIDEYNLNKPDIDYGDLMILPGFYDLHCHGYGGYDTNDAKEEGLRNWLKEIPSQGVCGLCPTTITQSKEVLTSALKSVAELNKKEYEGARILGINLEGPYISKEYKGAQPEQFIIKPDIEEFKEYQKVADGLIKITTVAPEEDDNLEFIKYCVSNGVNVSLGHAGANYEKCQEAIKAGASCFTHTYNGMSRFSHREVNMVGAALASDCFAEAICDCHHSMPAALKIFFRCKGKNGIMVSDGLMTRGLPIGTKMMFGGQEIEVIQDGTCRIVETGNFAGSTLKLNDGIKNLIEKCDVPFNIAISSVTSAPMRYMKMDDHKGYLRQGYDADIAVLDADYMVKACYVMGTMYSYE